MRGQEIQGDALGVLICVCVLCVRVCLSGCALSPKRINISVCSAHRDLDFSSMTQLWIRKAARERLIGFTNIGHVLTVCSWFATDFWELRDTEAQPRVWSEMSVTKASPNFAINNVLWGWWSNLSAILLICPRWKSWIFPSGCVDEINFVLESFKYCWTVMFLHSYLTISVEGENPAG